MLREDTTTTNWNRRPRTWAITVLAFVLMIMIATAASAHSRARHATTDQGDRGTNVKALHYLLRYNGHNAGIETHFNYTTKAKVEAFQNAQGLDADGLVGPNTWAKLTPTLRKGDTDSEPAIRSVQYLLNNKVDAGLHINGIFDAETEKAVQAFQRNVGIAADGIVGPITWRHLLWHYEAPLLNNRSGLCNRGSSSVYTNDEWGTAELIGSLEYTGKLFKSQDAGRITVNDISHKYGGDIAGHVSHEVGLDVDLRPIRKDLQQCSYGVTIHSSQYDRDKTRELIDDLIRGGNVKLIYFNDPVLINEFPEVRYASYHDDHLHVRYCEIGHPESKYRC